MPELKHQVWSSPDENSVSCYVASREADEQREKISPEEILVFEFFAASWLDAMNRYHDWQGWEPYKPIPDSEYKPYTDDEYNKQKSTGHHMRIL